MQINAFSNWQQRVADPLRSGWQLNQSSVTTEAGSKPSILSTYQGPGRERVLAAMEKRGLIAGADVEAINAAGPEVVTEAKIDVAVAEQSDRMHRALGVNGSGAAGGAQDGALKLKVVPDGARDLSPHLRSVHARQGFETISQTAFDGLRAMKQSNDALQAAAQTGVDIARAAARYVR